MTKTFIVIATDNEATHEFIGVFANLGDANDTFANLFNKLDDEHGRHRTTEVEYEGGAEFGGKPVIKFHNWSTRQDDGGRNIDLLLMENEIIE